jgi:hypothetical protein
MVYTAQLLKISIHNISMQNIIFGTNNIKQRKCPLFVNDVISKQGNLE